MFVDILLGSVSDKLFDILDRGFSVSPETAPGILLGLMAIAIAALSWRNYQLHNQLYDMTEDSIKNMAEQNIFLKNVDDRIHTLSSKIEHESDYIASELKDGLNSLKSYTNAK